MCEERRVDGDYSLLAALADNAYPRPTLVHVGLAFFRFSYQLKPRPPDCRTGRSRGAQEHSEVTVSRSLEADARTHLPPAGSPTEGSQEEQRGIDIRKRMGRPVEPVLGISHPARGHRRRAPAVRDRERDGGVDRSFQAGQIAQLWLAVAAEQMQGLASLTRTSIGYTRLARSSGRSSSTPLGWRGCSTVPGPTARQGGAGVGELAALGADQVDLFERTGERLGSLTAVVEESVDRYFPTAGSGRSYYGILSLLQHPTPAGAQAYGERRGRTLVFPRWDVHSTMNYLSTSVAAWHVACRRFLEHIGLDLSGVRCVVGGHPHGVGWPADYPWPDPPE